MLARLPARLLAAVAVLLLAAGTAFAMSPNLAANQAALSNVGASENAQASKGPDASDAPEASESPDASEAPDSQGPDGSSAPGACPAAGKLDRIVTKLAAAGITTTTADFCTLAAQVGVGGAVRVLSFAHASGKTPAQILAMFKAGQGWGQIAASLKLSVGPGIGWIMGNGHGHGHDAHPNKGKGQGH